MGLKFSGGFVPQVGQFKVANTYVPEWWNGVAFKPMQHHTATPATLNLPSANNKWMSWDETFSAPTYHTATPATLNLPSANNKWMTSLTL